MTKRPSDNMTTEVNACRLAHQIEDFWNRRGAKVETHVCQEVLTPGKNSRLWVVRSDMVNGKPAPAKSNTANLLSDLAGGRNLVDVKVFRGDRAATKGEIEEQMRSAILQRGDGRAKARDRFPDVGTKPVK